MKPIFAPPSTALPSPPQPAPAEPLRPVQGASNRVAARPAAAVLQRQSGFGQLSLDLRRGG